MSACHRIHSCQNQVFRHKLSVMNPAAHEEHDHLPRLSDGAYLGRAIIHWTFTADQRAKGWLDAAFCTRFRWLLLHGCARYEVACPVHCLMPDHVHLLIVGWTRAADQRCFIKFLRKHTNELLADTQHRWQAQAYDHVLRPEESDRYAFETLVHYITHNPVRAGLVKEASKWPYTGAILPGYPELKLWQPDFWQRYWRLVASRSGL